MKMLKYITLTQLEEWVMTTTSVLFNKDLVYPSQMWTSLWTTVLPMLNGSQDNPYSTTTPKEKLPAYFLSAQDIGEYMNDEYGDRLVSVPFRIGEYNRIVKHNLNKDEAMVIILQELISKALFFNNLNQYQYLKLFGTTALKYDPRYSIQEHSVKVSDFGNHVTRNDFGTKLRTDVLGPQTENRSYGRDEKTDVYGAKNQTETLGPTQQQIAYGQEEITDSFGQKTITLNQGATELTTSYGAQSGSTIYGALSSTTEFGAQSGSTSYGAQSLTDNMGGKTDTHSETQMNDLTFKNKSQDAHSSYTDTHNAAAHTDTTTAALHTDTTTTATHTDSTSASSHTDVTSGAAVTNTTQEGSHSDTHKTAAKTDTATTTSVTNQVQNSTFTDTHTTAAKSDSIAKTQVTNTSEDTAHTDSINDLAHQNVETIDKQTSGVKTIQELIAAEREILDWNPAIKFLNALADKLLLRAYYY